MSITKRLCLGVARRWLHYSKPVPLTQHVYAVERGQYTRLNDTHLSQFEAILDARRVVTDPAELAPHNVDWFNTVRGKDIDH